MGKISYYFFEFSRNICSVSFLSSISHSFPFCFSPLTSSSSLYSSPFNFLTSCHSTTFFLWLKNVDQTKHFPVENENSTNLTKIQPTNQTNQPIMPPPTSLALKSPIGVCKFSPESKNSSVVLSFAGRLLVPFSSIRQPLDDQQPPRDAPPPTELPPG